MSLTHSAYVRGGLRVPAPQVAGEIVAVRYEIDVPVAVIDGDIIEFGILPAYARFVDAVLDADDLDTGGSPALTLDVGIMSGEVGEALNPDGSARTCGNELFEASTAGQTGTTARMTKRAGFRVVPVGQDRSIGLKIVTDAATAAPGKVGLTVLYGT